MGGKVVSTDGDIGAASNFGPLTKLATVFGVNSEIVGSDTDISIFGAGLFWLSEISAAGITTDSVDRLGALSIPSSGVEEAGVNPTTSSVGWTPISSGVNSSGTVI